MKVGGGGGGGGGRKDPTKDLTPTLLYCVAVHVTKFTTVVLLNICVTITVTSETYGVGAQCICETLPSSCVYVQRMHYMFKNVNHIPHKLTYIM